MNIRKTLYMLRNSIIDGNPLISKQLVCPFFDGIVKKQENPCSKRGI